MSGIRRRTAEMIVARHVGIVRVVAGHKTYRSRSCGHSALGGSSGRRGIRAAAFCWWRCEQMANEECAHCGVLITEWSTVAKRDNKIFCCANCANAHVSSERTSAETATG